MKILLTGASGQLGHELGSRLSRLGELVCVDLNVADSDRRTVRQDLSDLEGVERLLSSVQPDLVVNAAAYTAVDAAEDNRELAFLLNGDLPGCLAAWAARSGALLFHYSTDYVFSGESNRPWREQDQPAPLNCYGESKLAGEEAIAASACRHTTIRTSWVYSGHGNNFVLTMLRLARERPELKIVGDQVGCPTWARNLARVSDVMIGRILDGSAGVAPWGLYHYCDGGVVSWFEFAHAIFRTAVKVGLLDKLPSMEAVRSAEYPQKARRPAYSVLDTSAIQLAFGIEKAGLEESLLACLEEVTHDEN
jgi:dTDP-4-dehydrorhamnose reductase